MSISDPFISKDEAKLRGTPRIASKRIKGISENERNVLGMSEEGDQDTCRLEKMWLGSNRMETYSVVKDTCLRIISSPIQEIGAIRWKQEEQNLELKEDI